MIRNVGETAGISKRVIPDLLEHWSAPWQLTRGMNPILLTQILGHSSLTLIRALFSHLRPVDAHEAVLRTYRDEATTDQPIVITARMQKLIGISFSEAQRMGENWIGTEHLLLGLLVEREGIAAQVLRELGVTAEAVRSEVRRL